MMILGVGLEMFGQVIDALAEECDLNFGRAGVGSVGLVGTDDVGLLVFASKPRRNLHARSRPRRVRSTHRTKPPYVSRLRNLQFQTTQHLTPGLRPDAKARSRAARPVRGAIPSRQGASTGSRLQTSRQESPWREVFGPQVATVARPLRAEVAHDDRRQVGQQSFHRDEPASWRPPVRPPSTPLTRPLPRAAPRRPE